MTLHFTNFQHTLRDTEKVLCVTTFNRVGIVLFSKISKREKEQIYIFSHWICFHDWSHWPGRKVDGSVVQVFPLFCNSVKILNRT